MMIFEKIKKIVVEEIDIEESEVTLTSNLEELGVDSISRFEIIMALEQEFRVDILDEDVESIESIGDIVKYIEKNCK